MEYFGSLRGCGYFSLKVKNKCFCISNISEYLSIKEGCCNAGTQVPWALESDDWEHNALLPSAMGGYIMTTAYQKI